MSIKQPILPSTGRTSFADASHPEPEDRRRATAATKSYDVDPDLQARLERYKAAHPNASNVEIGRKLGYPDGTAVSKYLSAGKAKARGEGVSHYDRDPKDIEDRLAEFFLHEERKLLAVHGEILRTSVVRQFEAFADAVRRSGGVGVIHSAAGLGKTSGFIAYQEKNPTAIAITANAAQCDARGLRQLMWGAISHRGYSHNSSRWDFMVRALKGSGRLILVDNAQRLDRSGRDFLFDLRDATGCPIVLIGNPEILERVAKNDQQHSRTLMEHEATLKDVENVVRQIIDMHTGDGADLYDLAYPIVKRKGGGYLRALTMTLASMREFLDAERTGARQAFESALAKSIHHKG
jgi:DNA transposition AAA+ family ATPase